MGNQCGIPMYQMDADPLVVEDKLGDVQLSPEVLEYIDMLANGYLTEKEMATMQLKSLTAANGTDTNTDIRKALYNISVMKYLSFVLKRGSQIAQESALYTIKNLSTDPKSHYDILASEAMYRMIYTLRSARNLSKCHIILDTFINIAQNPAAAEGLFLYHEILYSLECYFKVEQEIQEIRRGVYFVQCMAKLPGMDQFVLGADFLPRLVAWQNNVTLLMWPYQDARESMNIRACIMNALNDMLARGESKELLVALSTLDGPQFTLADIASGISTKKYCTEGNYLANNGFVMAKHMLRAGVQATKFLIRPTIFQFIAKILNSNIPGSTNYLQVSRSATASSPHSSRESDDYRFDEELCEKPKLEQQFADDMEIEVRVSACEFVQAVLDMDLGAKKMMKDAGIPEALTECERSSNNRLSQAALLALVAFGYRQLTEDKERDLKIEEENEDVQVEKERQEPLRIGVQQTDTAYTLEEYVTVHVSEFLDDLEAGDMQIQCQLVDHLRSEDPEIRKSALHALSNVLGRGIVKARAAGTLIEAGIIEVLSNSMKDKIFEENNVDAMQWAAWYAYCIHTLFVIDSSTKAKIASVLKEDENEIIELVIELQSQRQMTFFE